MLPHVPRNFLYLLIFGLECWPKTKFPLAFVFQFPVFFHPHRWLPFIAHLGDSVSRRPVFDDSVVLPFCAFLITKYPLSAPAGLQFNLIETQLFELTVFLSPLIGFLWLHKSLADRSSTSMDIKWPEQFAKSRKDALLSSMSRVQCSFIDITSKFGTF